MTYEKCNKCGSKDLRVERHKNDDSNKSYQLEICNICGTRHYSRIQPTYKVVVREGDEIFNIYRCRKVTKLVGEFLLEGIFKRVVESPQHAEFTSAIVPARFVDVQEYYKDKPDVYKEIYILGKKVHE